MSELVDFVNFKGVQGLLDKSLSALAFDFVKNPIQADLRIDQFVRSQINDPKPTPISYYQRCGSAFWWPQSCEHRDRIRKEVTDSRNEYFAKYQAVRVPIINKMIQVLTESVDKENFVGYFQAGEKVLKAAIDRDLAKISRLQKFEDISWSIFSTVSTVATAGSAKVVAGSAYAASLLKGVSEQVEVDVNSLHRFSEEPPGFSDNVLSVKGLQWDHLSSLIFTTHVLTDFSRVYQAVAPAEYSRNHPQDSNSNGSSLVVGAVFLGALVLLDV